MCSCSLRPSSLHAPPQTLRPQLASGGFGEKGGGPWNRERLGAEERGSFVGWHPGATPRGRGRSRACGLFFCGSDSSSARGGGVCVFSFSHSSQLLSLPAGLEEAQSLSASRQPHSHPRVWFSTLLQSPLPSSLPLLTLDCFVLLLSGIHLGPNESLPEILSASQVRIPFS